MAIMADQLLHERKPMLNMVYRYTMAVKKNSSFTFCHLPQRGSEIANSNSYRPSTIFFNLVKLSAPVHNQPY